MRNWRYRGTCSEIYVNDWCQLSVSLAKANHIDTWAKVDAVNDDGIELKVYRDGVATGMGLFLTDAAALADSYPNARATCTSRP